jgi:uncharacterized membrane protein
MPTVLADANPVSAGLKQRLDSIDLLRGLVMVIMALDHVRDYTSNAFAIDPTNLDRTSTALFLTRWITHFCAPVFVFLAGTGAFLSKSHGKTTGALSWFLLTRGLWLLVLELTLVRWGWVFNLQYRQEVNGQLVMALGGAVIWVIGASMIVLSCLVFLPTSTVSVFGIALIAFHNLFDGITPDQLGNWGALWNILHSGGDAEIFPGVHFGTGYTLLPWLGVMAAGYGFGALFQLDRWQRRVQLLGLGIGLTVVFVVLRYTNQYGDPNRWSEQKNGLFTVFSFLNCHKYPPSLLYTLMTLGPAIAALALFDGCRGPLSRFFVVFGRVPLFYYLLHLPLIHGLAVAIDYARFGWSPLSSDGFWGLWLRKVPEGYGVNLGVVYLLWIGVVLLLFPICRWFAGVKRRRRSVWLSYL